MEHRRLGRTNLDVSAIGLGGLHFSGLSNMQAVQIILRSGELGINLVEVGRTYTGSEEKAGFVMRKNRDRFCIATKTPCRKKESAFKDIDASLVTLKTDYIDIYQLHQVDSYEVLDVVLGPGGAVEALKRAKEEGKIKYIGITGHSPAILVKAIKTGEFDTVQVLFNIVEREALNELIPLANEMDVGILGMKPFGGGAFLEKDSRISQGLNRYSGSITGTLLRFVLSSSISSVLAGVKTVEELERNAAVGDSFVPLSGSEMNAVLKLIENGSERDEAFCHRCGYCVCCPRHIDIPLILRLGEYYNKYGSRDWPVSAYSHIEDNAGKCAQCGLCEERCPFHLPIRMLLKDTHARLVSNQA